MTLLNWKRRCTKWDLKGMASKEDIKGMSRKEDLQYLKEFIKDIKHKFIPQLSTQEEDKKKNMTYYSDVCIKLKTIGE